MVSLFLQFSPIDLPFTVNALGWGNKFFDRSWFTTAGTPPAR